MLMDSIKDFKDKYYLIHPESERVYNSVIRVVIETDRDGLIILDEDGQVKTRLTLLFPFRWWKAHFLVNPQDFLFEDEDLNDQDKAAHAALCRYVERFSLA